MAGGFIIVRGHTPEQVAPRDWRCRCGLKLASDRTSARAVIARHKEDLKNRTLDELLHDAWEHKVLARVECHRAYMRRKNSTGEVA